MHWDQQNKHKHKHKINSEFQHFKNYSIKRNRHLTKTNLSCSWELLESALSSSFDPLLLETWKNRSTSDTQNQTGLRNFLIGKVELVTNTTFSSLASAGIASCFNSQGFGSVIGLVSEVFVVVFESNEELEFCKDVKLQMRLRKKVAL